MVRLLRKNKGGILWGFPLDSGHDETRLVVQTTWSRVRKALKPWLSIHSLNIVWLDLRQVKALHTWLGKWIERQEKGGS